MGVLRLAKGTRSCSRSLASLTAPVTLADRSAPPSSAHHEAGGATCGYFVGIRTALMPWAMPLLPLLISTLDVTVQVPHGVAC